MVQLDSIRVVTRAHHHIVWSRFPKYREHDMPKMLTENRSVFEHFSHDACILPMETYPYWRRQMKRRSAKANAGEWRKNMPDAAGRRLIKRRIRDEGPLSSRDFGGKADKSKHAWMRPPHKLALDYMWLRGDLAISHRQNFIKHYDLAERVIPSSQLEQRITTARQIDWLCRTALERLKFAKPIDIQRFWMAMTLDEVKQWLSRNKAHWTTVEVERNDGTTGPYLAPHDIEKEAERTGRVSTSMKVLSPFDPLVRDRERMSRVFGFDYRIEIFVPAAKRKYGYYVYPILCGDRMIGRIEFDADRTSRTLRVKSFWPEPGFEWTSANQRSLRAELRRFAKLAECEFDDNTMVQE